MVAVPYDLRLWHKIQYPTAACAEHQLEVKTRPPRPGASLPAAARMSAQQACLGKDL
jgi:hypothetical protein